METIIPNGGRRYADLPAADRLFKLKSTALSEAYPSFLGWYSVQ